MTPVSPVLKHVFGAHREVVFAKNQPEYRPLKAAVHPDGRVVTKWKLSWRERFTIFFSGHIWLQLLTFNRPLQPVKLSVTEPHDFSEGLAERPEPSGNAGSYV
jgi:hypothetical protein